MLIRHPVKKARWLSWARAGGDKGKWIDSGNADELEWQVGW